MTRSPSTAAVFFGLLYCLLGCSAVDETAGSGGEGGATTSSTSSDGAGGAGGARRRRSWRRT